MGSGQHGTVEHLAAIFGPCQEEIVAEWRRQAGKRLRELRLDR
jgi:hypothetical protein